MGVPPDYILPVQPPMLCGFNVKCSLGKSFRLKLSGGVAGTTVGVSGLSLEINVETILNQCETNMESMQNRYEINMEPIWINV